MLLQSSRIDRLARLAKPLTLATVITLGAVSCDKVPLTAPAGTVITLISATNVLPINGSTDLVAVLIENGTTSSGTGGASTESAGTPVHNGTLVTFTTSLGRVEPAEARTVNGRVTVALIADGRSGTATVTAFSGSASEKVEVKIGAAAAERVTVIASPTSVPPNGGTVAVSARVEDASGNGLSGVPVTFSTNAGTLAALTVLTNEGGFANTTLSTTAAAKVTASAGGKSSFADITLRARSTIAVAIAAGTLYAGGAATFTVTPGNTVPMREVTIDFGDGESLDLGAISGATVVQHFYEEDDIYLVEVRGTDIDGGTAVAPTTVAVLPIPYSLSASPSSGTLDDLFVFTVNEIPATVPIEKYFWSFGDGTSTTTGSKSTSHKYGGTGIKTIVVTIYPVHGAPLTATIQIQVTIDSQ